MALKIRMSRSGTNKRPFYKIVVADSRSPRDGRFIERIGHFNPMVPRDSAERFALDQERAKYWVSVGAQPSDRVAKFLHQLGLGPARVIHEQTKKHLPRAKTQERMKAAEGAAVASAAAGAAAAAAPAPAPAAAPAEDAAPAAE